MWNNYYLFDHYDCEVSVENCAHHKMQTIGGQAGFTAIANVEVDHFE
jgi:hypothetical protein